MKDKLYCVSLNEFIRVTTGWLYSLAPGHKPRFINEIVDEMIVRFKRDAKHIGDDFFYYEVDWFQLRVLVEYILVPIKQFSDLNLSKIEYEFGISVDDQNRKEFAFVSLSSSIPEEYDFIDLDACIGNIVFSLKQICGPKENRQKDKWIEVIDSIGGNLTNYAYECSCCLRELPYKTKFCPNCGTQMESEE